MEKTFRFQNDNLIETSYSLDRLRRGVEISKWKSPESAKGFRVAIKLCSYLYTVYLDSETILDLAYEIKRMRKNRERVK